MNFIYEKLFDYYCDPILQKAENFDAPGLEHLLSALPLTDDTRRELLDAFWDRHLQWSTDGFALGLHLGLSLLHDQVRRPGKPHSGRSVSILESL